MGVQIRGGYWQGIGWGRSIITREIVDFRLEQDNSQVAINMFGIGICLGALL